MKIAPRTALFLALAAALPAQQPCQAEFDGPVFKDNVSMGGPNFTNCIKTTAKANLVVFAVEVFTGEATGTSTVGIWDHDSARDEPKSELARGSFTMRSQNGWQGANLSTPVVLAQGQTLWVSWIPVTGCQASIENSGRTLPGIQVYKWSRTNSAPWNGPYQSHQWKYRLWCQPIAGGIDQIGKGCPDGFGNVGLLDTAEIPRVGNANFYIEGTGLPPSASALAVIGLQPNFPSVDLTPLGGRGCFLHTDQVLQLGRTTTPGTPSKSDGTLRLNLPIPNDNALRGFYLRSQFWVADSNSSRTLAAVFTNGLGITIQ